MVQSPEHAKHLEEAFSETNHRMVEVPGFRGFNLLKASDGSAYVVRVVWDSEAAFRQWTESDHFRRAHQGQANGGGAMAELSVYEVIH
jgi:heme oxygenase (staphylobilin-producing)